MHGCVSSCIRLYRDGLIMTNAGWSAVAAADALDKHSTKLSTSWLLRNDIKWHQPTSRRTKHRTTPAIHSILCRVFLTLRSDLDHTRRLDMRVSFLCASNFVRSHLAIDVCLSVKRVDCDKTKAPSEKSSIMTNRKSPTSFPMSLRWTSYVAPNPQWASKANFIRQMARCGRSQTPQLPACFQTVCHTMELDAHSLSAVADQLVKDTRWCAEILWMCWTRTYQLP